MIGPNPRWTPPSPQTKERGMEPRTWAFWLSWRVRQVLSPGRQTAGRILSHCPGRQGVYRAALLSRSDTERRKGLTWKCPRKHSINLGAAWFTSSPNYSNNPPVYSSQPLFKTHMPHSILGSHGHWARSGISLPTQTPNTKCTKYVKKHSALLAT